MPKDWTGNKNSIYKTIGASNHTDNERQEDDFYATDPEAVKMLLELEGFSKNIWEPACGTGNISKVLEEAGHIVHSSDLINRGFGLPGVDFLLVDDRNLDADIITNPPYKYAKEFVLKALDVIQAGHKIAMFLKLTFLEGKSRYEELFSKPGLKKVYVASSRLSCPMNGDFENSKGKCKAVCYAWFIWEKGYEGQPTLGWFNNK